MAQFAQKHPTDLTRLVGEAVANGAKTPHVAAQLAAGTFNGWEDAYEMPLETVRYYGKKERDKRAAKAITPEARDNPRKAVDDLARLLLSAAQKGLESARPQIDKDPKGLKEWGDALKTISALVSDTTPEHKPSKRNKPPSDPLTARLTAKPASPSLLEAPPVDEGTKPSREAAHTTTETNAPTEPPNGGVLAQGLAWAPSASSA